MVHIIKFTDDVLKVQIGVKFIIEIDNGDRYEWWRLEHIESPIYATKALAREAFELYLQSIAKEERAKTERYIKQSKLDSEKTVYWRNNCEKHILEMWDIAKAHMKYEDAFLYTKATDKTNQYNIGD